MTEFQKKPNDIEPEGNVFTTIDEFESRFFPVWYEKQRSLWNTTEEDSFGENLARFSAERHLKNQVRWVTK